VSEKYRTLWNSFFRDSKNLKDLIPEIAFAISRGEFLGGKFGGISENFSDVLRCGVYSITLI